MLRLYDADGVDGRAWVEEPLTEELLQELLDAPAVESFVEERAGEPRTLSAYLQQLLAEKGLERAEVVRAAGLNSTFGYQIFTGARGASRDKVLALAFAMRLTLRETNRALQAAGVNALYCKNRRDAVIIYCIDHGATLLEADDELFRLGEATIL